MDEWKVEKIFPPMISATRPDRMSRNFNFAVTQPTFPFRVTGQKGLEERV